MTSVNKLLFNFYKQISSVVTMEDTKAKEAACDCAGNVHNWEKPENTMSQNETMLIAICSSISDQIIEEAVKCNRENDAVLLANTILVYIGVLKVVCMNCRYFDG